MVASMIGVMSPVGDAPAEEEGGLYVSAIFEWRVAVSPGGRG